MEDQTRHLIRLLARDDTERLVEAMRSGVAQEAALAEAAGISQQTANRRLHELEQWCLVGSSPGEHMTPGKRGPRPSAWNLLGEEALRFGNVADSFALELMELRAARMRTALEQTRRRQLRGLDDDLLAG